MIAIGGGGSLLDTSCKYVQVWLLTAVLLRELETQLMRGRTGASIVSLKGFAFPINQIGGGASSIAGC